MARKEQQKSASSKEVDAAEYHQQVLKNDLVKICQTLQKVSTTTAMLTREKGQLQLNTAQMEIKQKRISAALTSKPSKELVSEMVDEVHLTIIDLKEDLQHLETEMSEQTAKEEQVKQKLSQKEKEADENIQALENLKAKQALFSSALDFHSDTLTEVIHQAENRQQELDLVLEGIRKSLEQLTKKSASLAEEKEQLEKEITKNKKLQEKLLSQKASMEDTEIIDELIANIQGSIDKNKKHLAHVESKLEKKKAKQNQLKLEAAKKEKDLVENKQRLCELKQKNSVICSTLEAKRKSSTVSCARSISPRKKRKNNARSVLLV